MQICLKQKMAGLLGAAYFPRKIRQLVLRCVIRMCERRLHIFRVFEKKKPEVHKCSFPGFGLGPRGTRFSTMDRADVPEQLQGGRSLSEQQAFVFRVTGLSE